MYAALNHRGVVSTRKMVLPLQIGKILQALSFESRQLGGSLEPLASMMTWYIAESAFGLLVLWHVPFDMFLHPDDLRKFRYRLHHDLKCYMTDHLGSIKMAWKVSLRSSRTTQHLHIPVKESFGTCSKSCSLTLTSCAGNRGRLSLLIVLQEY